jgi:hypothetical protein
MKITPNKDLQANFRAGLQIVGEEDNELQWLGTDSQWKLADKKRDEEILDAYWNEELNN